MSSFTSQVLTTGTTRHHHDRSVCSRGGSGGRLPCAPGMQSRCTRRIVWVGARSALLCVRHVCVVRALCVRCRTRRCMLCSMRTCMLCCTCAMLALLYVRDACAVYMRICKRCCACAMHALLYVRCACAGVREYACAVVRALCMRGSTLICARCITCTMHSL